MRGSVITILVFNVITFAKSGLGADCQTTANQLQIDECIQTELNITAQRLEVNYNSYLKALSGKERDLLQRAQETWLLYRDTNCQAAAATFSGARMQSTELLACKLKLTQERIAELKRIYE